MAGAPGAPATPGGAATGTRGGAGGGGIPVDFRRYETSKQRLKIAWNLPVFAPDLVEQPQGDDRTSSGVVKAALPRQRALVELGAEDHRPLLVLRECDKCRGTDHAVLSRKLNNDRTLLMTRWFHCVKLPNHVLEADHPFRNLFDTEHPPHLFLCRHDGSEVVGLDGNQPPSVLWEAMLSLLRREYTGDPEQTVKELLKVLNEFDIVDARRLELEEAYEKELLKNGPKSRKLKSIQKKLDQLAERKDSALAREAELADLGLRPLPAAESSTGG